MVLIKNQNISFMQDFCPQNIFTTIQDSIQDAKNQFELLLGTSQMTLYCLFYPKCKIIACKTEKSSRNSCFVFFKCNHVLFIFCAFCFINDYVKQLFMDIFMNAALYIKQDFIFCSTHVFQQETVKNPADLECYWADPARDMS